MRAAAALGVLTIVGWADPSAVVTGGSWWAPVLLSVSVVALSVVGWQVFSFVVWRAPAMNFLLLLAAAASCLLVVAGAAWPLVAAILGPFVLFGFLFLALSRAGRVSGPIAADIAALVRGLARFALPAASYSWLSGTLPGTHPGPAWPGFLLGALNAGVAFAFGVALMITRPKSTSVCHAEFQGKNVIAYGASGNLVLLFDVASRRWVRALGSGAALPAPLGTAIGTEAEGPIEALRWPVRRLLPGMVRAVCVVPLPAGSLLASAGDDGSIHVWSTITGKRVASLRGDMAAVHALCVIRYRDSVLLAAAGDGRRVRLWDLAASRSPARILPTSLRWTRALCPVRLGDDEFLAVAGAPGRIEIRDPADGRLVRHMTRQRGVLNALCTVPADGRLLLAAAGAGGTITLWDPAQGELIRWWQASSASLYAIHPVPSADGTMLLAAGDGPYATLWTLSGELRGKPHLGHAYGWVQSMCQVLVHDKPLIATAGYGMAPYAFDPLEA